MPAASASVGLRTVVLRSMSFVVGVSPSWSAAAHSCELLQVLEVPKVLC